LHTGIIGHEEFYQCAEHDKQVIKIIASKMSNLKMQT